MSVKSRTGIRRRRWTAKEFYRLLDLGFFNGQRVQLIEGEILQMASQKNYHAIGIKLTEDSLNAVFGPNYWVRVQMSLDLTPYSVPDPDLAVIPGAVRTHDPGHNPTTALLIVEVSETTLWFDRGRKASVYARVGIADYWILNLVHRHLEILRNPIPDSTQRYGFGYADQTVLTATDYASPLAAPQARIAVADLLPERFLIVVYPAGFVRASPPTVQVALNEVGPMLQSIEGIFRDGKVELLETPPDLKEARVIVTFLPKNGPIDLRARGITEAEAARMRAQFETIADDWESPEMDVYDDL